MDKKKNAQTCCLLSPSLSMIAGTTEIKKTLHIQTSVRIRNSRLTIVKLVKGQKIMLTVDALDKFLSVLPVVNWTLNQNIAIPTLKFTLHNIIVFLLFIL